MKVRVYYQGLSKEIDDIAILKEPTTVPAEEEAPSGIGFGLAIALVGIILLIVILDIIIMKRIGKKKEKKSE